jgi:hypothetical protein
VMCIVSFLDRVCIILFRKLWDSTKIKSGDQIPPKHKKGHALGQRNIINHHSTFSESSCLGKLQITQNRDLLHLVYRQFFIGPDWELSFLFPKRNWS